MASERVHLEGTDSPYTLTTERAESSYGQPVAVGEDGTAYGVADLKYRRAVGESLGNLAQMWNDECAALGHVSLRGVCAITADTAAARSGLKPTTLRDLVQREKLEIIRDGFGHGRHAYLVESVNRYQRERRKPGNPNWRKTLPANEI